MKHSLSGLLSMSLALALTGVATSCVDHDYDLSKDIDLTISVGGDLALPSSSTDSYTMAQILDLDEHSSIQPVGAEYGLSEGDYVLVQGADPTNTTVSIPRQKMTDIRCNPTIVTVPFAGTAAGKATVTLSNLINDVSIADSQFDEDVKSISQATTNIGINFRITAKTSGSLSGTFTFEPGFTVEFPSTWTIQINDATLASYAKVTGSKLTFTKAHTVNSSSALELPVKVTAVDLRNVAEGQGLYAPGRFRLEEKIVTSGPVTFASNQTSAGSTSNVEFEISPLIPSAEILSVTGCITPDINITSSEFAINDVPDFLKEPGNNLDIENPQVHLTIINESPVEVNVNCRLLALDENGATQEVWIGDAHGTAPITIAASATSHICVSRLGTGAPQDGVNVAVPDLGRLIATIPRTITVDNVSAKVPDDKEFTFVLGHDYNINVDYKAVVPLAFGPELQFVYTTDEKGWDEDLEKYSFKQVVATLDVTNTVPLDMVPEVIALDHQGNPINDVEAIVDGTVAAGTIDSPTSTTLKVTLQSSADNIGNLDGVRFTFRASCPEAMTGKHLNQNQALRFTNIKLKIIGGVGVDLN